MNRIEKEYEYKGFECRVVIGPEVKETDEEERIYMVFGLIEELPDAYCVQRVLESNAIRVCREVIEELNEHIDTEAIQSMPIYNELRELGFK